MTQALKLKVDFKGGTFEGEGDPERLERLYQEFRERVTALHLQSTPATQQEADDPDIAGAETIEQAVKARRKKRASRSGSKPPGETASRMADYSPARVKDLDLSGLESFYREWVPKNHPERILLFAYYLAEHLGIASCTTDQIFSCYMAMKERVPKAFVQAFRDASGNGYSYIEFKSLTEISVPIHGRNHVEHGGVQKKNAARR